ncbi:hypothetical protein Goklo_002470 [Gossypium klotzschianum]|uniref:WAT1-related protein n=1 Tax=Gossypium klotzschianum TaxID=34286 RepID=A0A7J8VTS0_9ROSI|nr:hypothetical protein [Gossypium klotzschianum]
MAGKWGYKDVVPITAMVAVECSDVVLSILFKAASLKGMSYFVYIAYCYVLATLVFVPLAFLSNRKKLLLPLEFPLISRICLLGLLGFSGQVCAYKGLELGSPTLASAISNLAPAFTFILASKVMKIYPEEITVNVYYNMSVAIIALAACLIKEQNLSSWTLHPSISVVSVLYSGLFGFPFSSGVHTWGVRVKGPVFVAIFRPTSIVIAVIMSAIFLGEAVYLGSVIGGVILTIGLYAVLWGKAKEEEMKDDGSGLSTKVPLLKSQNVEEN